MNEVYSWAKMLYNLDESDVHAIVGVEWQFLTNGERKRIIIAHEQLKCYMPVPDVDVYFTEKHNYYIKYKVGEYWEAIITLRAPQSHHERWSIRLYDKVYSAKDFQNILAILQTVHERMAEWNAQLDLMEES